MSTKKLKSNWKKEPKPCHNFHFCGNLAVAESGDGEWYCYSCCLDMYDLDNLEIDESLGVCHEQLEIQSKEYA